MAWGRSAPPSRSTATSSSRTATSSSGPAGSARTTSSSPWTPRCRPPPYSPRSRGRPLLQRPQVDQQVLDLIVADLLRRPELLEILQLGRDQGAQIGVAPVVEVGRGRRQAPQR